MDSIHYRSGSSSDNVIIAAELATEHNINILAADGQKLLNDMDAKTPTTQVTLQAGVSIYLQYDTLLDEKCARMGGPTTTKQHRGGVP